MAGKRITLASGAYEARSLVASAQRCVNLYPEYQPQEVQEPSPVTHYQTPGLAALASPPTPRGGRGLYRATNGDLYACIGTDLFFVSDTFRLTLLGKIADLNTPVSMVDNGTVLLLVDGTTDGYAVDLSTKKFGKVADPAFYGANKVDYVDTFFALNKPGSAIYYVSLSQVDFGMLTGSAVADGTSGGTAVGNGTIQAPGSGYANGTYVNVPLRYTSPGGTGTGSGAQATIKVTGGAVTSVSITKGGTGYVAGDDLTCLKTYLGNVGSGFIFDVTSVPGGGAGYQDGQYNGVPLTGGSGSGATANMQVTDGSVVSVDIITGGQEYVGTDVLGVDNAYLGGTGSGFTFKLNGFAPAFDPLDFAQKAGGPDPLVSLICVHREIWLIGTLAAEVAVNTGAADFAFAPLPGAYMEAGTLAPNSVARHSLSVFWLAQDRQGKAIVVQTNNYMLDRISTYAIEGEMQSYERLDDAIGYTYQLDGHQFYVLTFPTADKTWVFDIGTHQWHEWAWSDPNGGLHRHRSSAFAFAYGKSIVCDWQTGQLMELDREVYQDINRPIPRIRSFPHLMDDGARVTYAAFMADMSTGEPQAGTQAAPRPGVEIIKRRDGSAALAVLKRGDGRYVQLSAVDLAGTAVVTLRYSDDRGATYSGSITQSMGAQGEYSVFPTWRALGSARDRVFEISWTANRDVALDGAFIDTVKQAA